MNAELRVQDFLAHIVQAIVRIQAFSVGLNETSFLADLKTQDAVIRNIEVIGEACSNIRKLAPELFKPQSNRLLGASSGLLHPCAAPAFRRHLLAGK